MMQRLRSVRNGRIFVCSGAVNNLEPIGKTHGTLFVSGTNFEVSKQMVLATTKKWN
jgi:hypothetical protein